MKLSIEFLGGCEQLFGGVSRLLDHDTPLEDGATIRHLLAYLRDHHMRARPDLFLDVGSAVSGATTLPAPGASTEDVDQQLSVRPGIIVLINNADWELFGMEDYRLQEADRVTFISTLHGG
ncbi:hypothetical protein H696_00679 [Fonticula alba]|uniref:Ubiquitin-related modifier 1 homolog n=1 Tax=Fonticula alba TaxID=691883 RepID=A0A058ZGN7_FONAL|nr:hypothetical protein H696_00679 [Fonticula alba]KCV73131.1 hypothetical protein H696_00679 [Fonticula alba]|eukprot:XP_009492832.1 hypothetical protein H696_00679 [Fonticula alba]